MRPCFGIRQCTVDLAHDQADGVALVADADDEFTHQRTFLILKSLYPIPCASNQCISASQTVPSSSLTVATPTLFRQRPLPCMRSSRRRTYPPVPQQSFRPPGYCRGSRILPAWSHIEGSREKPGMVGASYTVARSASMSARIRPAWIGGADDSVRPRRRPLTGARRGTSPAPPRYASPVPRRSPPVLLPRPPARRPRRPPGRGR